MGIYIYIKKESDRVVNVLLETSYGEIDKVDIKRSKKIWERDLVFRGEEDKCMG